MGSTAYRSATLSRCLQNPAFRHKDGKGSGKRRVTHKGVESVSSCCLRNARCPNRSKREKRQVRSFTRHHHQEADNHRRNHRAARVQSNNFTELRESGLHGFIDPRGDVVENAWLANAHICRDLTAGGRFERPLTLFVDHDRPDKFQGRRHQNKKKKKKKKKKEQLKLLNRHPLKINTQYRNNSNIRNGIININRVRFGDYGPSLWQLPREWCATELTMLSSVVG